MVDDIIALSHEFGTTRYVRGGGGNTSCKDAASLWIKPSGTTLAGLTAGTLVRLDRSKIQALYTYEPPANVTRREADVKDIMTATVYPDSTGRPSVEAPLHDSFPQTFVVHTHPAWVNGMTCGAKGHELCATAFPDAMWVPYVDPGYTLCIEVREAMHRYEAQHGQFPAVVVLENHGIFIAADTPADIRERYAAIMDALAVQYRAAGIALEVPVPGPAPSAEALAAVQAAVGDRVVAASGPFAVPRGPLTPDHIVYAKSFPLVASATVTAEEIAAYTGAHGFPPSVITQADGVFGIGDTAKDAALALEFALDGAHVAQLAQAFGGVRYLSDASREFIEQWEVEAYRKQISAA